MTPILAVDVTWGGEFEGALDDINLLFDMPTIIDLGPLSINRTILIIFLMTLVGALLFARAFKDPKVVPGKLQNFVEVVIDFIRGIAIDVIGPVKGLKFVPLLTAMFVFVFLMNVAKLTPGLMLPPTSRIAIPGFLAVISWLVYVGVGLKEQGLNYLKDIAFPPGVPKVMYIILTPIELLSTLVLRPFALMVRLFANMVAGHILVVITLVAVHVFLYARPGLPIGIVALVASPAVFAFELAIVTLQAYIFTMLTAVYIGMSAEPAH